MEEIPENKLKWIQTGYDLFGKMGPESLNVEKLSLLMGVNRSSFYHYFGDVNIYESQLLKYHISRFQQIWNSIKDFEQFDKQFVESIIQYTDELAFHRQLLINESTTRYKECFDEAKKLTEQLSFKLWSRYSALNENSKKDLSLYQAIRDYYLVHNKQTDNLESSFQNILSILKSEDD
ncbi:MAG: TetR/AcrR family transcriptional regulator [Reichenbachiella sp.]